MKGRAKNSLKRLIAAAALAIIALALCGCGASLTVAAYTDGGVRYNSYTLSIDIDTVQKMEESAATDKNGQKYNVPDYFCTLFEGFDCELVDAGYNDTAFVARYRKRFGGAAVKAEEPAAFVTGSYLRDISEQLDYSTEHNVNPFLRTYDRKSDNPFNGVREAYDSVKPYQSSSPIQRLKNGDISIDGVTGEVTVAFPAIPDAFPYVRSMDESGLLLNYVQLGSRRMESSGKMTGIDGDSGAYVFSRYFDGTDATVEFVFKRPVPYGWYIVAILAGGAVIGVIILATRKKKPKNPTLLERFPYNPEEYRDYDSNLPMNM